MVDQKFLSYIEEVIGLCGTDMAQNKIAIAAFEKRINNETRAAALQLTYTLGKAERLSKLNAARAEAEAEQETMSRLLAIQKEAIETGSAKTEQLDVLKAAVDEQARKLARAEARYQARREAFAG